MTEARRVPNPVSGVDVMALPLSTLEGFVLSRADGVSSVEDISMMVGVELDKLLAILERLADLGAVSLPWVVKRAPAQEPAAPADTGGGASGCIYDNPSSPPAFDGAELDGPGDIDRKTKRRILNAYYSLRGRNFYQLLGVTELAEKAEIRRAYFGLSKLFHPDAFFGRELGDFKPKMEAVFKRLTEAYEVLGRKKRRREYDEYLRATNKTRATQTKMEQARVEAQVLRDSRPPDEGPVREVPQPESVENPLKAPRVPREVQAPTPVTLRTPLTVAQRKAAAAKRLRRRLDSMPNDARKRRRAEVASRPDATANASPEERRDSAVKDLARSISDSARVTGGPDRVSQYRQMAKQAEEGGDLLSAANALQLALALLPDDDGLKADYERVSTVVVEDLARNYEKQARYEEKVGKWAAAANSWKRVVDGRPQDPEPARQAAAALLRSGGDLHLAQKYARRATTLDPDRVANLVVLARVMLAAGLKLNARRELEKAVKLDPKDEMVKNLLKEAK